MVTVLIVIVGNLFAQDGSIKSLKEETAKKDIKKNATDTAKSNWKKRWII